MSAGNARLFEGGAKLTNEASGALKLATPMKDRQCRINRLQKAQRPTKLLIPGFASGTHSYTSIRETKQCQTEEIVKKLRFRMQHVIEYGRKSNYSCFTLHISSRRLAMDWSLGLIFILVLLFSYSEWERVCAQHCIMNGKKHWITRTHPFMEILYSYKTTNRRDRDWQLASASLCLP